MTEIRQKAPIAPAARGKKQLLRLCRRLLREVKRDHLRHTRLTARLMRAGEEAVRRLREEELSAFEELLCRRRTALSDLLPEARRYINAIEDPAIRRIFRLYYLEGKSWQRVALECGCLSEASPRKRHDRYLAAEARGGRKPPADED